MKKRGRPSNSSNPKTVKADSTIGCTVHTLVFWGFPVRKVCEVVGLTARKVLQRQDNHHLPLSGERIEQIYEHWKKEQPFKIQRKRYVAKGLRIRCPDKTASIDELAQKLLNNCGEWKEQKNRFWCEIRQDWLESSGYFDSDSELTPKAANEINQVRLVFAKRGN